MAAANDFDKELAAVTAKTAAGLQNVDQKLQDLEEKAKKTSFPQGASEIDEIVGCQSHLLQGRWQELLTRKDEIMKSIDEIISCIEDRKRVTESKDSVLSEVEGLQEDVAQKNKNINTKREELSKIQNKIRNDIGLRRDNIAQYSTHLGLDIHHQKDKTLVFTFKYISRDDPERPFSFHLRLEDDKTYKVIDCQPMVSDLEKLVTELNESNDLKKFVFKIRKVFSILANK